MILMPLNLQALFLSCSGSPSTRLHLRWSPGNPGSYPGHPGSAMSPVLIPSWSADWRTNLLRPLPAQFTWSAWSRLRLADHHSQGLKRHILRPAPTCGWSAVSYKLYSLSGGDRVQYGE